MKKVGVSLKALYEEVGEQLRYVTIEVEKDGEYEYYSILNRYGVACMDGEVCSIVGKDGEQYELISENEIDNTFYLTEEELKIAVF